MSKRLIRGYVCQLVTLFITCTNAQPLQFIQHLCLHIQLCCDLFGKTYLIQESVSEVAYSETKISCEMLRNLSLFQKNIKGTSKKQIRRASILRQHIKEITTMLLWILPRYLSRELRGVKSDFDWSDFFNNLRSWNQFPYNHGQLARYNGPWSYELR